jgi:peptidoglycan hydrolase-like protein with peptidoglycan-binding domain
MIKKIGLYAASALLAAAPLLASADALTRQLDLAMTGSDVSALQTFLATDPTLYPQGLVTGYFGFLTKSAVANFQSRNGLPAVGRVGPMTLPVLNLQMAGGISGNTTAPTIYSIAVEYGMNNATVRWNTTEAAMGTVYYSTSPLTTYENAKSVTISGATAQTDTAYRSSQSVSLQNLQANTTYYYMAYSTDADGNVSVTWPATFRTTN